MAAARMMMVATAQRRRQKTKAGDVIVGRELVVAAPEAHALVDMGSFNCLLPAAGAESDADAQRGILEQAPSLRRLRSLSSATGEAFLYASGATSKKSSNLKTFNFSEVDKCGFDSDEDLPQRNSAEVISGGPGIEIRIHLLSASDLHQGLFMDSRTPCAVLTFPGPSGPGAAISVPASHTGEGHAMWDGEVTFSLPAEAVLGERTEVTPWRGHGFTQDTEVLPQHAVQGVGVARDREALPGSPSRGSKSRSQGKEQLPKAFSHSNLSPLRRSKSGRRILPSPAVAAAVAVVFLDIFSAPDLKKHLGRAVLPLAQPLQSPGSPCMGKYKLVRKSILGRVKEQGFVRVIITVQVEGEALVSSHSEI